MPRDDGRRHVMIARGLVGQRWLSLYRRNEHFKATIDHLVTLMLVWTDGIAVRSLKGGARGDVPEWRSHHLPPEERESSGE